LEHFVVASFGSRRRTYSVYLSAILACF